MKYAKGKNAIAECMRSGQKMRYRDLVQDGHIPGLLVHPDWWEPKHPQETAPSVNDPIALHKPSPEISAPAGEGETIPAVVLALSPNLAYLPSGVLAGAATVGLLSVPLDDAVVYRFGQPVFIRRNDLSWFVSQTASEADTPTFTVFMATPYAGGSASAANVVYIGQTGSGVLA